MASQVCDWRSMNVFSRSLAASGPFLVILLWAGAGFSQSLPTSGVTPPTSGMTPPASGVAVLNDGRVFQGTVQEVPGGYRVQYSGGSSILPFNQISVTSATLVGAYEAFRDNIRTPSADAHLKLAEWCLVNGLYAQADIEVQSALRLEPMRTDAVAILKQVDAVLRPGKLMTAPVNSTPVAPRTAIHVAAFANPEDNRPSGLSRETQLDYMRKVQPLLINSCGNAGCHGPQVDNQMKLMNARINSPGLKMATEHNLSVLFTLIDDEHPYRSPLLTRPRDETDVHKKLFASPRQQSQYELLERWVHQVAQERAMQALATGKSTPIQAAPQQALLIQPGQPIQQVSGTQSASPSGMPSVSDNAPRMLPDLQHAQPISNASSSTSPSASPQPPRSDLKFLERIRQSSRPDAFDPEEFNRMMHSGNLSR